MPLAEGKTDPRSYANWYVTVFTGLRLALRKY
jgi:hypothetical protein